MRQNLSISHLLMLNDAIQQLLAGTKDSQNDSNRCLPESHYDCDSGDMPAMVVEAQVAPPHGCRQTPI
jgi:hypothetical protein